jgi:hypothetical protein
MRTHGNKYDYRLTVYTTAKSKVKIICSTHGVFEQTPNGHLQGWGCKRCAVELNGKNCRRTLEQFLKMAKDAHGETYDYSNVRYKRDNVKVEIICNTHGSFMITPTNHIYGKQGCRPCNMSSSRQQDEWLESLCISKIHHNKKVIMHDGSYILADAFVESNNTVYEYWGDYWHGNPDKYDSDYINPHSGLTMGELYTMTQQKRSLIQQSGYNLVEIWESEFKHVGK